MSFSDFGVRSFVPETRVAEFATFLKDGKVMASRCRGCGHLNFPPRSGCASCSGEDHAWEAIDETGHLLTYTKVMYGPAGFEDKVPYTLAVAAFPMGVNVFGQIAAEVAPADVKVGMRVSVVPRPLPDGRISYHFVKTRGHDLD